MTSALTGARGPLETADGAVDIYRLDHLSDHGDIARLPKTVKILLENLLRRAGTRDVSDEDVRALAAWPGPARNIAFMPGRVLMQDFTGVPAVVDLAAMRSAMARDGGDPSKVEPARPRRPHHRSLRAGGPVPVRGRVRGQHRVGVPAQRRAIRASCAGRSRRSTASAWSRPARASATR